MSPVPLPVPPGLAFWMQGVRAHVLAALIASIFAVFAAQSCGPPFRSQMPENDFRGP